MLSLPLSGPVASFKACLVYVLDPLVYYSAKEVDRFADVPGNVRGLLDADAENRLMREQGKQAVWARTESDALRSENRRLRSLLNLKAPSGRAPVWAHVLERDPLHWYRSLTVDAGGEQGVVLNSPVLGANGGGLAAVGRVVEVRPKSSVVMLVTDEPSSVAAFLSTAAVEGLVQGQGSSRLLMSYLPPDAVLEVGDRVYTSPTSATFPAEVLIGTVVKVYPKDPFLTFQSVEVRPAVDASSMDELMILKPEGAPPAETEPQEARGES